MRELIEREHNVMLGEKLAEERRRLHALPAEALPAYTAMTVKVRRWSTIRVLNHTYSVPARLIGQRVRVLVHHDHLEVYFASSARQHANKQVVKSICGTLIWVKTLYSAKYCCS